MRSRLFWLRPRDDARRTLPNRSAFVGTNCPNTSSEEPGGLAAVRIDILSTEAETYDDERAGGEGRRRVEISRASADHRIWLSTRPRCARSGKRGAARRAGLPKGRRPPGQFALRGHSHPGRRRGEHSRANVRHASHQAPHGRGRNPSSRSADRSRAGRRRAMTMLFARDALTPRLQRVSADRRAGHVAEAVFAVFESDDPTATLLGIVTTTETARFPQRIFADLLPNPPACPVSADTDLVATWLRLDAGNANALPVVDAGGNLLGAVTRESLWTAMFAQQRSMFAEFAMREAQHRGMLQAIPDDFICLTADGLLVEAARPEALRRGVGNSLWPVASEDSIGKHVSDLFPLAVAQTLMAGVQCCLDSKVPGSAECV